MKVGDLQTPCLVVDRAAFEHNVRAMSDALPGDRLRPHVKAFKSTALARELVTAGHSHFCCATAREVIGMAEAGMGDDLLLANELIDPRRLGALAELSSSGRGRVTVAVDSEPTLEAAATAGVREVLVDVNVGLPRCGCRPEDAGRLAEAAWSKGLEVRGVMGYEGHVVTHPNRERRIAGVDEAMALLLRAHDAVGGDVISAGGTGTYDLNTQATEIQAGSFVLMDWYYDKLDLPFRQALFVWTTVISASDGGAVCDGGLKALGMDHGDPRMAEADVLVCSDEHTTFIPEPGRSFAVGDRVALVPGHVDPTVARHERLYVIDGVESDADGDLVVMDDANVVDTWPVDLRHW